MYRLRRPIEIALEPGLAVHWSADGDDGVPDPAPPRPRPPLDRARRRARRPAGSPTASPLGVCEGRAELGDLLWLECNAAELHGVSFTKGCYVGQENTARMNWRQKVNRRLVVVPAIEPGPRTKAFYPELGLAVEHRRVDDLTGITLPAWLNAALAEA